MCDLKLAIDGTIVMSQNLRAALDSMYDAKIPEKWLKVSRVLKHVSQGMSFFKPRPFGCFQGQLWAILL